MLILIATLAHAEHAGVLPAQSWVAYGGGGFTTYSELDSDAGSGTVDRVNIPRVEGYLGVGVAKRVQFSAYLPVFYSFVSEGDPGPCSATSQVDCRDILALGRLAVDARVNVLGGPVKLTVGIGGASSAHLRDVRMRYTMPGQATVDFTPSLYLGKDLAFGKMGAGLVAFAHYDYRVPGDFQPDLEEKAPADDVRAGLEFKVSPGKFTAQVGAYTYQRLGGTGWLAYPNSDDRWATSDYDDVSAGLKLSADLGNGLGAHLGVHRVLWVNNGAPDALDVTLGVHKYFSEI